MGGGGSTKQPTANNSNYNQQQQPTTNNQHPYERQPAARCGFCRQQGSRSSSSGSTNNIICNQSDSSPRLGISAPTWALCYLHLPTLFVPFHWLKM